MFVIRRFKSDDFFQVLKIVYETLPEQYNPHIFIQTYETFPNAFWIAEKKSKIIGFILGAKTYDETAIILIFNVVKEYQRMGIGSLLLRRFLREMTLCNIKKVELQVRVDNMRALNFYKKHGFNINEALTGFYQNKYDGYAMVKIL